MRRTIFGSLSIVRRQLLRLNLSFEVLPRFADVNAKDDEGGTPLDLAIEDNYPEIADLLRKHGAKTIEELKAAGN